MMAERFRAKWAAVRVKKTRQNKKLEPRSDSIGTEKALERPMLRGRYRRSFEPFRRPIGERGASVGAPESVRSGLI
jgi:hypothetical protein